MNCLNSKSNYRSYYLTKLYKEDTVSDNYSIRAGAGCGKSTTLEWTETGVPKGIQPSEQQEAIFDALKCKKSASYKGRVACFNTSIMKELEPRFPGLDVRNNHKLGYHSTVKFLNIKPKFGFVKGNKYEKLARTLIGNPYNDSSLWPTYTNAIKLASMARITLTGSSLRNTTFSSASATQDTLWEVSQSQLLDMATFYSIDVTEAPDALKYVEPLINAGIASAREGFDFDDMVFLPNVFGCRPDKVDRCYIDEMQDLNAAQHGLLEGTAEQFVIVGDVHQSIYGFAGADPQSMPRFESAIDAKLLPLTVTRRCPHKHVEYCKRFLPDSFAEQFRAADSAPDGSIEYQKFDDKFYASLEGTSNLCLSRTNAPMVRACFMCWKNNIPAVIRGRNVASTLAKVIKRINASDNESLIRTLIEEYEAKVQKLKAADKLDLAEAKRDELDILVVFATETKTPDECVDKLFKMFDDADAKERAVQFSTVHKAKGLEADNLAILTPELLPHPGISKIGEFWAEQERNIAYVCATRGKDKMFLNE